MFNQSCTLLVSSFSRTCVLFLKRPSIGRILYFYPQSEVGKASFSKPEAYCKIHSARRQNIQCQWGFRILPGNFLFLHLLSSVHFVRVISLWSKSTQLMLQLLTGRWFILLFFWRRPTSASVCNLLLFFLCLHKGASYWQLWLINFSLLLLQIFINLVWWYMNEGTLMS